MSILCHRYWLLFYFINQQIAKLSREGSQMMLRSLSSSRSYRPLGTACLLAFTSCLVLYVVMPLMADVHSCKCEFSISGVPGVKFLHCAIDDCVSGGQCCGCGVLSSQCRCCANGTTCTKHDGSDNYGVGRAACMTSE
jgi:hypothetical protein